MFIEIDNKFVNVNDISHIEIRPHEFEDGPSNEVCDIVAHSMSNPYLKHTIYFVGEPVEAQRRFDKLKQILEDRGLLIQCE